MIAYPVSTRVNNPANDSPACIAPLARLPPLEALLNVLERKGLVMQAAVLEEIARLSGVVKNLGPGKMCNVVIQANTFVEDAPAARAD